MSGAIIVTGIRELDKKLASLPVKVQKSIGRSALQKTCTMLKRAIKSAAPKGPTGQLIKSIGSRVRSGNSSRPTTAKVGINVGKKTKKSGKYAPHGHLVALGTQERFTKSGASRGVMPANHFVRQVYNSKASAAQQMMADIIRAGIEKAASK